jgi:hypothetical protein
MHTSIARTLLVGGLVFTSLVGQVGAVVTDPRDIQDSKFREHIENLIAGNVVSGYSDGTFRPSEPVTRGQMAKFIVNGFNLGADGNIQQFGDVPSTNPFFAYINILKTEGIISGYSDGTYRPNAYVTRGETAKFIHNALKRNGVQGTEVGSGVMSDFPDVTGANVFKDSIIYLSREKIINGFSDGTFKPNNNVTRGEMAKMVDGARGKISISSPKEVIDADNREEISISYGQTIKLSVSYTPSTGFEPFQPIYDSSVFELTRIENISNSNGMPGGDTDSRVYYFKSIKLIDFSKIEVGIHKPWDTMNTRQVQKTLDVSIGVLVVSE